MKSQIQYLHLFPKTIQIPSNESWTLLDFLNNDTEQVIILEDGAKLYFYSARTSGKLHLRIIHQGTGSNSQIQCGFHTQENGKIEAIIKSSFEANDALSEIHILSLAETGGEVLLDSSIEIQEGVKRIVGRLKERHIFLGEGGKIRGIPALIVHSDDIEASHALAIDRISDEELFYLRSRGFSRDEGTGLLLDGAISEIFAGLEKVDEKVYEECKKKVLGM
ncbi:hypothetical protein GW819_03430 [Candidatus Gracilibacteria bacterium]|nr:hypothetical protein [bacterium]NDK19868.1 hypothetical protein [Candidatus Gracilibacteria bacterium]OIO76240.1 MAG: hypothetical protein AUJ87_03230 [Candidatus Gracilibacteria bacterium CG1_02_38_174]PIQ11559.1 MAG: hypothetical protein COW68_02490 [Candidatus Gracilibacteria bacterium CG18_big_fil_WC_8_21_14_2_50_38_16]PIQ42297.1 MAG: hypothetical protein COW06_00120 [Candidatus Gracilibacteria bacterium CG12_big_fil_rev_8_21_14_0_65_38_15]PIZ02080.1 MAG: hypothetical protein COY60_0021